MSDVLMPGIDGLEMVHRLRSTADAAASHAPVIFYTANYLEPEMRPVAEACGVSRVILRNTDPRELLDAVDEAFRRGPVEISVRPTEEFAQAHVQAVNAKLVEKVRALHHTERRFEAMAASSPVGIVLLDADGDAGYVNPRLSEITGLRDQDLLSRGWLTCLDRNARAEALEMIHSNRAVEHRYRNRFVRPDGTVRWLRVQVRPVADAEADLAGGVVVVDDITDVVDAEDRVAREAERRQTDEQHREAERLDSLRRVAGGMAHDFNNLLGAMLGYLHLAIESITDEMNRGSLEPATANALLADLGQVSRGGDRAAGLTAQLLAFGRREIGRTALVEVNSALADLVPALAAAAGPGIDVDLCLADARPAAN